MNFSIRRTREHELDLIKIKEENTATEIALLPGFGAMLHAFAVRQRGGDAFNVIDNYRDLTDLKKDLSCSYKGPKLSPFPCRIPEGRYTFDNKKYKFSHLFSDGTAIHGLLFNKPFTVLEEMADDTSGSLLMEYIYKKEDDGYPFDYCCQVRYTLFAGNTLEVVTSVTNLDTMTIPLADGWHPYFRLGGRVDDWQLQFHSEAIVEFDARLVPTGRLLQYDVFDQPRQVDDTFLDNCFVLKPGIVSPACEIYNPANGLRVSFFPDASYPYLQIYTPATRESIAIENLSGAPNCFNNHMGLSLLPPGHSQIFTVRYTVSV